jgi:hypothetical protein
MEEGDAVEGTVRLGRIDALPELVDVGLITEGDGAEAVLDGFIHFERAVFTGDPVVGVIEG